MVAAPVLAQTAPTSPAAPQARAGVQPAPAPAAAAPGAITMPENATLYGKMDPNLRKATVIINGEVITGTDVDQRVALIVAASQGQIGAEELERLRLQVLRNLMDETLQIQEAKAQKIEVENSEVESTYARVAQQNFGQNTKAMDAYLVKIGSSPASLKRQIRGELSWQRLLGRNVEPFVNVSNEEVKEVLDRLQAAKGTEEYRVGEIFLAANPENKPAVFARAKSIVDELKKGGSFVGYARQYSQASTAAVGGDLGWIRAGQLPDELNTPITQMAPGQLVGPIETQGGFSIVALIDRRKVLTADPRDAILSLKQISIAFPPGTSDADAARRAQALATAVKTSRGCSTIDGIVKPLGAEVVANDQMKARDLPDQLQNLLLKLSPGEATPPFGTLKDGIRILMLCGRDDAQISAGPNFDELQNQIEQERVNKRAQMYLRDLRRDAVIDYST
ncbi:foldase protein PrsA [Parablastomonas sp. CN1-191]|uniref:peptidylprolyl isomerase n=1 Tax=Parablastomonas sp. CN1-191 TaxID=3400908 RepID=UPI003BF7978D